MESQIAKAVISNAMFNKGMYIPPRIVKGRYICFGIDNIGFDRRHQDGKDTMHGTVMAVFQQKQETDTIKA